MVINFPALCLVLLIIVLLIIFVARSINKRRKGSCEKVESNDRVQMVNTSYVSAPAVLNREAYCSLQKHALLSVFTFGIWQLIWTYRTTRHLNRAPGAEQYDPAKKLLLCIFAPFYQIYWYYRQGQRLEACLHSRKESTGNMTLICLVMGMLCPLIASILIQDKINELCMPAQVAENN